MTRQEYIELVLEKYRLALASCPRAGTGAHAWALSTANLAARAGLPKLAAVADITRCMSRAPKPGNEILNAVEKAYAEIEPIGAGRGTYAAGGVVHAAPVRFEKPKASPQASRRYIEMGDGADEMDWLGASPVSIDWEPGRQDAVAVLRGLWQPDEFIFCGGPYDTEVAPVSDWIRRFEAGAPIPPHIIPNPMDGTAHETKTGKPSWRCDAAVCGFRYAVAEFDDIPSAEQLAFWWGWRLDVPALPIAALISSGGKSVHAWLRVDARNREAWEDEVENGLFRELLVPLGCDPACKNESRLSRLPGHYREEKKNWQRLLYLDGNA